MKDREVTKKMLTQLQEVLNYFEEVVLVTPKGSYFLHSTLPARCDERLYIYGVISDPEHK